MRHAMSFQDLLLLLLILGVWIPVCVALPTDKQEPMKLFAESADLDQEKHEGKYSGNVQLDQGSTHLRASTAFTKGNNQNKLVFAEAFGSQAEQAHYWTQPAVDKDSVHAYADKISYYPDKHLVELSGHALIVQGKNSFSAPFIRYDLQKQHVISTKKDHETTVIIMYPEKHS